jgi:epoxyqueuosine reductase
MAKRRIEEPTYKRFVTGPIKRFDESNHAYSRGDTREIPGHHEISDTVLTKRQKNIPGYTQEDYALFYASRTINYIGRRVTLAREVPEKVEIGHKPRDASGKEIKPEKLPVLDPAEMSSKIKKVAKWFGADLVGVAKLNMDWFYSLWGTHTLERLGTGEVGKPIELPEEYQYVVVMATEMNYENIKRSPAVCATTDLGYSKMAFMSSSVAQYIRELGYKAIPSGNDMSLSIPIAIDAGLGELGRHGLLITEEFGPRIRLCKVYTSLPLTPDKPIDIGVQAFCEACMRCAESCPAQAIMNGERTDKAWNASNNEGVLKWPINAEKCLGFWVRNGAWCAVCIRVCPWNKPRSGLIHGAVRAIATRTSAFDSLFTRMDKMLGYGKHAMTQL